MPLNDDRSPRATPGTRENPPTPAELTALLAGRLPGVLGIEVTAWKPPRLTATMPVTSTQLAPNGRLHAGSVVALADTACGLGCRLLLPESATGFATLELKTSYLGTAREGTVTAVAELVHGGRRTQIWDATVTDEAGRTIALFRCTQLLS